MYPELPKKEVSFMFEKVGDTTGRKYDGQFVVKCVLSMAEKHQLELEKTRLLADYANPTDALMGLAVIMATLRTKIVESPEWWKKSDFGSELLDEDVAVALYNKIRECEADWKKALVKKAEDVPQGNG